MSSPRRSQGWPRVTALTLFAVLAAACPWIGEVEQPAPVYEGNVQRVLRERCASCHEGDEAEAGWRAAASYLETIACIGDAESAVLPPDETSPLIRALDDADHGETGITAGERALLERWVRAGVPVRRAGVHDPGIIDPRSSRFHGRVLRDEAWGRMLDGESVGACGGCHDGAPSRPSHVVRGIPRATPCTDCHIEDDGALGCGTCHGSPGRPYPHEDRCFFPGSEEAAAAGAHSAHVAASEFRAEGLRCAACHPDHDEVATDSHGDGQVDVRFDETLAGADASYDPGSRTCAVACHDRGGQVPRPTWDDIGPRECGDCHPSPPDDHPSGACTLCHREADEEGEAIEPGPFHVNGVADLGDGSGLCGACHGVLDDPSPSTERHPAHLSPTSTEPIPCEACHVRPEEVDDPGHLDDDLPGAEVTFGGVATARGATPVLDDLTCRSVACHGEGLIGEPERSLRWDDTSGAPGACGACHGLPPAPPHGPYDACQSMFCHGGEVTRSGDSLGITPSGRAIHIDGVIDSGGGGG